MIRQTHFLFFSPKMIRLILLLVIFSQLNTIVISGLDFSYSETFIAAKESEDPKPKEGKNAFDFLEESKFLVASLPIVSFFSFEISHSFHKDVIFFEVIESLESPPPEIV